MPPPASLQGSRAPGLPLPKLTHRLSRFAPDQAVLSVLAPPLTLPIHTHVASRPPSFSRDSFIARPSILAWVVVYPTTHLRTFILAAPVLSAFSSLPPHYRHQIESTLTPPYTNDPEPYLDDPSLQRPTAFSEHDRPWLAHRTQRGSDDRILMPGTGASGSQSIVTNDASRRLMQQPAAQLSPNTHKPSMRSLSTGGHIEGQAVSTIALPPLRHISSTPPTPSSERRPGNPLGVHSILNPPNDPTEQRLEQRGRRRSATQMDSPSPIKPHLSHGLPSISRPNSVDSSQEDFALGRRFPNPGKLPSRHLINPRSPKAHRASLEGPLGRPTATIDAQRTPFLEVSPSNQPYGVESATSQPLLSAPPAVVASYFPPSALTPGPRRASSSFPPSGSASPMISYSPGPYSRPPSSIASSQFDPSSSSQPGSYMNIASSNQSQELENMEAEQHNMIPMQGSGASSYQLMTIKSHQGHNIQIPVDVQAASRVADEKRKRNAGASARFRARRKEKEREASSTIQNLQQQLRDAGEDVDYYRSERDFFRSIVYQQPGADRMHGGTRPPSPRLRRGPGHTNPPPSTSAGGSVSSYSGYSESGEPRSPERNVRRRTSSYHPPSGPAAAAMNGSGNYSGTASTFSSINPPPPPPQQHQQPQQPQQQQQHHAAAGHHPFDTRDQRPLPDMAEPPRPPFRDPFASASGRYENSRNWHPPGSAGAPDSRR